MSRTTKGLTVMGRPVTSREERGYVLDVEHIERLLKAVVRDTRIPLALVNEIEDHGRAIIRELRPYMKGTKWATVLSSSATPKRRAKRKGKRK